MVWFRNRDAASRHGLYRRTPEGGSVCILGSFRRPASGSKVP